MTTLKLNLSYKWDKDTYLQGSKSLYNDILKNSSKRFIGWFFIALSQFGLVAFYKKGAFGLLLISTIFLIYWYFLRWQLRKFILLNAFKKSPLKDKMINIEIDSNEIIINKNKILWDDITRVLLEDVGVLLYYEDNFIFIPNSAFDGNEKQNFLQFLKENLKDKVVDNKTRKN